MPWGSPSDIGSSSFQWWAGGDFEMCFQYLVFVTTSSALFGLLSMFYAGRYYARYRRVKRPTIVMVKLLLSMCIAVNSVFAAYWVSRRGRALSRIMPSDQPKTFGHLLELLSAWLGLAMQVQCGCLQPQWLIKAEVLFH